MTLAVTLPVAFLAYKYIQNIYTTLFSKSIINDEWRVTSDEGICSHKQTKEGTQLTMKAKHILPLMRTHTHT